MLSRVETTAGRKMPRRVVGRLGCCRFAIGIFLRAFDVVGILSGVRNAKRAFIVLRKTQRIAKRRHRRTGKVLEIRIVAVVRFLLKGCHVVLIILHQVVGVDAIELRSSHFRKPIHHGFILPIQLRRQYDADRRPSCGRRSCPAEFLHFFVRGLLDGKSAQFHFQHPAFGRFPGESCVAFAQVRGGVSICFLRYGSSVEAEEHSSGCEKRPEICKCFIGSPWVRRSAHANAPCSPEVQFNSHLCARTSFVQLRHPRQLLIRTTLTP